MFGDSTVVNPFGFSMPDYTGNRKFGVKCTNITGSALTRGAVVMPCFDATVAAAHGFDPDIIWGADGLFHAVMVPATLYDATTGLDLSLGPFVVCTDLLGDSVADNKVGTFWGGGPNGSMMDVQINHDWTTAIAPFELLFATEGVTYLSTGAGLTGVEATRSRAVGRVLARIPADPDGTTETLLKRIQFSGMRGI